jgi:CMP-N-acetylneuraminic acid synthetase
MNTGNSLKILIPARKNSKSLPFKNRKLFKYTAEIIPECRKATTYVFSDDEIVNDFGHACGFNVLYRDPKSAQDGSTTKDLMEDFCSNFNNNETVVMLYLTYPDRTWEDVERAIKIFQENSLRSLLCQKEVKQTPYLMMYELPDNRGEQIIQHNFSRRQDYRKCFEISHYLSIIRLKELPRLNNDLYNEDTYFMEIAKTLDVDTQEDMECILKS